MKIVVVNLKTYEKSFTDLSSLVSVIRDVSQSSGVRIIAVPPLTHMLEALNNYDDIFSQHADPFGFGSHTGHIPIPALKRLGVKGAMINHSEDRLGFDMLKNTIEMMNENRLESIVCGENADEIKRFAEFKPTYLAVEPPELIGTGISISSAKPELITESLNSLEGTGIPLLCGAGVSKPDDVKKAIELGASGVMFASAFVKSKDPKSFLESMVSEL